MEEITDKDLTFINKRSMAYDRGMNQQVGNDMVLDNKYNANLKLEKQYGTLLHDEALLASPYENKIISFILNNQE